MLLPQLKDDRSHRQRQSSADHWAIAEVIPLRIIPGVCANSVCFGVPLTPKQTDRSMRREVRSRQ